MTNFRKVPFQERDILIQRLRRLTIVTFMAALFLSGSMNASYGQNDTAVYQDWVAEMKTAPRGPFKQIRWFCNDRTIHPPRPYPCADRGGGRQHGQWNDRVKQMRAQGYAIANVLVEIDPAIFIRREA